MMRQQWRQCIHHVTDLAVGGGYLTQLDLIRLTIFRTDTSPIQHSALTVMKYGGAVSTQSYVADVGLQSENPQLKYASAATCDDGVTHA